MTTIGKRERDNEKGVGGEGGGGKVECALCTKITFLTKEKATREKSKPMPMRRRQERSPSPHQCNRRSSSTSRRRSHSRSNSGSSSSDNDFGSAEEEEEEEEEEEATVAEPASVLGRFHRVYVETVDVTQSEIAVEVLYHGRWLVNCIDLAMLKISVKNIEINQEFRPKRGYKVVSLKSMDVCWPVVAIFDLKPGSGVKFRRRCCTWHVV